MRMSDGSSDVCSSDLRQDSPHGRGRRHIPGTRRALFRIPNPEPPIPAVMDTALTLTTDMALVLGLVVLTMLLFLFERVRADVVALVVLVVLGLTGLVAPEDIFSGFSSNAVMNVRSEEHTSELQSLMRNQYAVFCLKKKNNI